MATRSELVSALSTSLGVSAKTMDVCARYVREAGLIAQKGRGPSAAQMGPSDAINLLLAIMSSDTLEEAPACARRARDLVCFGLERNKDGAVITVSDSPFQWLLKRANLGTALERLVDFAARRGDVLDDADRLLTNIHLEIDRPGIYAELSLDDGNDVWVAKFGVPVARKDEVMPFIQPYRAMAVSARADLYSVLNGVVPTLLGREPSEGEVVVPPWATETESGKRKRSGSGKRTKRK